jgi:Undecaprenyl-phosphate glucose phosphotransferase
MGVTSMSSQERHAALGLKANLFSGADSFALDQDMDANAAHPRNTWSLTDPIVSAVLLIMDWVVIFCASIATWFIYQQFNGDYLSHWDFYAITSVVFATIFVVNGLRTSVYGFLWGVDREEGIAKAFRGFVQSFMIFVTCLVLLRWADTYSRATLVGQFFVGATFLFALRRFQFNLLQSKGMAGRIVSNRVILVGPLEEIEIAMRTWRQRKENVHVIEKFPIDFETGSEKGTHQIDELAARVVAASRACRPDRIVILPAVNQREKVDALIEKFLELPVSILVSTEPLVAMHGKPSALTFGGLRMLRVVRMPLSARDRIVKRGFDFAVSLTLLILLFPLLVAIALAIKYDSPGPAVFVQRRKGFNQSEFSIYKFRTMRNQSSGAAFMQTRRDDLRVTRIGRWLRRWNIDELPQLINVLRGDMSLVGPRPHAIAHDNMYYSKIATYARRHNMKPGITGLAQARGFRGATETLKEMEDRVHHDLIYIQNWSPLLDIKILLMTVFSSRAHRNAF